MFFIDSLLGNEMRCGHCGYLGVEGASFRGSGGPRGIWSGAQSPDLGPGRHVFCQSPPCT